MTDDAHDLGTDEDYDGPVGDAEAHEIEFLFAQTASGVTVEPGGTRIKHSGVSPMTLCFSDGPDRVTDHVTTSDFVGQWSEGEDSFAEVPPNAVLSLFADDEVTDVVVVLTDPVLEESDLSLSYGIDVIDGELIARDGPVGAGSVS